MDALTWILYGYFVATTILFTSWRVSDILRRRREGERHGRKSW